MGLIDDGYGFAADVQEVDYFDNDENVVDDNVTPSNTSMLQYNGYWYEIVDLSSFGQGTMPGFGWAVYSSIDTLTTSSVVIANGNASNYQSALNEIILLIDSLPVNSVDDPFQTEENLADDPFDIPDILPPIDLVDFDELKPDNIGGGGSSKSGAIFDLSAPTSAPYAVLGLGVIIVVVGSYFKR